MEVDFGYTANGLHERVLELLEIEDRGLLLDAPSGIGELSHLLREKGFDVIAGDIDEDVIQAKDVQLKKIDLNTSLPFENNSLDFVVNVEGLEHLENPHHTIKEFARVLKSGGKLIMTTPNVLNIFSRLRYFLIGYHEHFGDYYSDEDNFYVLHINPVGFPELDLAIKKTDLVIEEVTMNQDVRKIRGILFKIFLSFCAVLTKAVTKRKIQNKRMADYLLSKPLIFGEILIIKCRKMKGNG